MRFGNLFIETLRGCALEGIRTPTARTGIWYTIHYTTKALSMPKSRFLEFNL